MTGSSLACVAIARPYAPRIPGLVPDDAELSGMPDLHFRTIADMTSPAPHGWNDTANAVGCNHPPGFKSPILRERPGTSLNRQGACLRLSGHLRLRLAQSWHARERRRRSPTRRLGPSPRARLTSAVKGARGVPHDLAHDFERHACGETGSIEALPCLRSWKRTGGRPARAASAVNLSLIHSGRSGVPSSRVNTRPESVRSAPTRAARRAGPSATPAGRRRSPGRW